MQPRSGSFGFATPSSRSFVTPPTTRKVNVPSSMTTSAAAASSMTNMIGGCAPKPPLAVPPSGAKEQFQQKMAFIQQMKSRSKPTAVPAATATATTTATPSEWEDATEVGEEAPAAPAPMQPIVTNALDARVNQCLDGQKTLLQEQRRQQEKLNYLEEKLNAASLQVTLLSDKLTTATQQYKATLDELITMKFRFEPLSMQVKKFEQQQSILAENSVIQMTGKVLQSTCTVKRLPYAEAEIYQDDIVGVGLEAGEKVTLIGKQEQNDLGVWSKIRRVEADGTVFIEYIRLWNGTDAFVAIQSE